MNDPPEGQRIRHTDAMVGGGGSGARIGGRSGGGGSKRCGDKVVVVIGIEDRGGIKMKDPMPVDKISAIR